MKRANITLLFATLLSVFGLCDAAAQGASAYAISDATTGHILEEHNGDKKLQVASLTKVATAMVTID